MSITYCISMQEMIYKIFDKTEVTQCKNAAINLQESSVSVSGMSAVT